jgi:hypothetical protein
MPTGNTQIETHEAPAPAGVFLDQTTIGEFLAGQEIAIREALRVIDDTERLRNVVGTAKACPKLMPEDVALDAADRMFDKEAVWRKSTDHLSEAIAYEFPERPIFSGSENEEFFTDRHKLFAVTNGSKNVATQPVKTIYYSLLTAAEDKQGDERASEETWQDFLFRALVRIRQFRAK